MNFSGEYVSRFGHLPKFVRGTHKFFLKCQT